MFEFGFLPLGVLLHTRGVLDTQLLGEIVDQLQGRIERISQKHSELADCHDLKGEPQPVVVTTPTSDQLPVLVIEVEKPFQLNTGQRPEPAVAALIGHADMKSPVGPRRRRHRSMFIA
uniref:Uncharacterized protein n=1 Tax=Rhodococcus sp. B2 TaxID=1185468 RepID=A0A8A6W574_9NOCA|nr:hypothetical protein [Rhodococcus sp. B2]